MWLSPATGAAGAKGRGCSCRDVDHLHLRQEVLKLNVWTQGSPDNIGRMPVQSTSGAPTGGRGGDAPGGDEDECLSQVAEVRTYVLCLKGQDDPVELLTIS